MLFEGGKRGIRLRPDLVPEAVEVGDGPGQYKVEDLMVHDERAAPAFAFLLTQLTYPEMPIPLGILRAVDKTPYDQLVHEQIAAVTEKRGKGDIKKLLHSGMTWKVGP